MSKGWDSLAEQDQRAINQPARVWPGMPSGVNLILSALGSATDLYRKATIESNKSYG